MQKLIIYWCRRDLRLSDNRALTEALNESEVNSTQFLPLWILEDYMTGVDSRFTFGLPSRKFLSKALPEFAQNFKTFVCTKGKGADTIIKLAKNFDVKLYVNEDVHPDFYKQISKLKKNNINVIVCDDALAVPSETVTKTGNVYSVFTPFKIAVWSKFVSANTLPAADLSKVNYFSVDKIKSIIPSIECTEDVLIKNFTDTLIIKLLGQTFAFPNIKLETISNPLYSSEKQALKHWSTFLSEGINIYDQARDMLDTKGTSQMSTALAWGLVSARTLMSDIVVASKYSFENPFNSSHIGQTVYISELIWREFYKYLLFHYPDLLNQEFQFKYRETIKWQYDKEALRRFDSWVKGETGYPIVDAAMHEISKSGLMHNRARMVAASILTKNLGIDWRFGQEYFRAALYDIDDASNCGGWQWSASVGADPKPIRIFNPYLQAEKFDKDGLYQNKWLPEEYKNSPPKAIVPHVEARAEALKMYGMKSD